MPPPPPPPRSRARRTTASPEHAHKGSDEAKGGGALGRRCGLRIGIARERFEWREASTFEGDVRAAAREAGRRRERERSG
eukprot:4253689-Pleurochrysis_carterae.AAC.1